MKYLLVFIFLCSLVEAKEGDQTIHFGVGANIISNLEGYSEPGFGAVLGTEIAFNDQVDVGVAANISQAQLSEGQAFFQYGASFVSLYTIMPGKFRPKVGGLLGFQQSDLAGVTTNYINLGLPLQGYFTLKNTTDLFVEIQPGSLLDTEGAKHYINISFGMAFKLAD